jgi:acetyl-CoA C-acetyltransferase
VADAYIIGAVRTPVGVRKGKLAGVHPADLSAQALRALVNRTGIDPAAVDDVVMGCVSQVGPQALDIARTAWLSAGLPESVPGVTIDRQCGSSQQALHFAAQGVMSGTQDLVVAAGVENMGMIPMGSNVKFAVGAIALGHPLGATGGILATKLLHELERSGGRYGLQTMCEGGGQANATIIERLG